MPALYLTENDVRELLDMDVAIDVLEQAFRQLGEGRAMNVPRVRARGQGVYLHTMCAAADYLGVVGWKSYTTTALGARFLVGLSSAKSGELLALIEGDYLGQLRTGAASAVATEFMARPDSKVVGLFGAGKQARTQLKGVCTVRNIELVEVYSRNIDKCQEFADLMSEWCGTQVVPMHTPDDVATEKDIVICATTARTPLFEGRVLDEGTHLNVVGSNFLNKAEIDVTTVRRCDAIVCDSIEQCRLEAGDFAQALEDGVVDWSNMHELSEVVTGRASGRQTPESITLFKSVGLAIEDVALAERLFQLATREKMGKLLPF
ncbi:MAG: ornithine cyclodeaminase family protein [Planctomycetaceae bacterium]|nr:MAG: ornithine cyclodeaminase family protein [Planctomycetaceae bacterium]